MSNTINHMCMNILYKNISDPKFKEYYTLDEVNEELQLYEDSMISPVFEDKGKEKDLYFHMNYRDYLFTLDSYKYMGLPDPSSARACGFMDMALVK